VIPEFDDNGYLPPGIHPATLAEIEARFGSDPEIRRAEMQSLHWLIDLARRAAVKRIVLNGSFVAGRYEPNDVDCALLIDAEFLKDPVAQSEIEAGLPFLEIKLVGQKDFDYLIETVFGSDRDMVPKGVVEIVQWN
jgi:hypothetical protein